MSTAFHPAVDRADSSVRLRLHSALIIYAATPYIMIDRSPEQRRGAPDWIEDTRWVVEPIVKF